jgi:hypothetical protein
MKLLPEFSGCPWYLETNGKFRCKASQLNWLKLLIPRFLKYRVLQQYSIVGLHSSKFLLTTMITLFKRSRLANNARLIPRELLAASVA